ncbi:DUF7503 family protein [Natrinema amylolyticum]|nr:hypothetical protein [Natrinema amylolyticum]
MSVKDSMTDYLAQHPRMIGALFTLFVLLSQAGSAVAVSSSQVGP